MGTHTTNDTRTARQKWDEMMREAYIRGYLFHGPEELKEILYLFCDWRHDTKSVHVIRRLGSHVEVPITRPKKESEGLRDDAPDQYNITRTRLPSLSHQALALESALGVATDEVTIMSEIWPALRRQEPVLEDANDEEQETEQPGPPKCDPGVIGDGRPSNSQSSPNGDPSQTPFVQKGHSQGIDWGKDLRAWLIEVRCCI